MENLFILFILLLLSGFFSGSETALIALSMAKAEALRKQKRGGAENLFRLKQNTSKMLITILIGNNVVNIGASAMATVIATDAFGSIGPGIAVGLLTIFILIFGEITPKSLSAQHSERISLLVATPIYVLMKILFPLVWFFQLFTNWLEHKTRGGREPSVSESELITMAEHGEKEGVIETDEREMIERVFNFNDLKAEDVMTPRRQVFRIDARLKMEQVLPEVLNNSYSRIPTFHRDPDEITGVLMLRDILNCISGGHVDKQAKEFTQEPIYTPANTPIDKLIVYLRDNNRSMAIVLDEHGAMVGVITLEDILEELVGEIYDESDVQPQDLTQLDEDRVVLDGASELRIVEEHFNIDLPGKPTDTINRWILEHTERIPQEGESFEFDGVHIEIQDASSRRVHQVIFKKA